VDKRDPKGVFFFFDAETASQAGTIDDKTDRGMLGNLIVRNPSKKTIDSSESEVKAEASASNGDWIDFFKLSKCLLIKIMKKKKISRLRGIDRIGPHNKEVLSVIFGSLLGDGHAFLGSKRVNGVGTRITFYQEQVHVKKKVSFIFAQVFIWFRLW